MELLGNGTMSYNFKPCNRDQLFLLPPNLKDWLPEDELAWFVLDAVSLLDLSALYKHYRSDGWGRAAYEPQMMVALLIYSYCLGERSSRKIERLCKVDVAYRIIAANQFPDHTTLAWFRRKYLKELESLFIDVLKLCHESGLIQLGVTALDGTKIQGNTSLSSNKKYDWIQKEVKRMLEESEQVDAEEDERYGKHNRGDELPKHLRHREARLKRLKACQEAIEKEAQATVDEAQEKIERRKQKERETGKKVKGRTPKEKDIETEKSNMKANITDPESKPMKTFQGFVQGYNGQAIATEEQLIIAAELCNESNDQKQLEPMIKAMKQTLQAAGIEETNEILLADAGYCSETNLALESNNKLELLIATKQDAKQRKELGRKEHEATSFELPKTLKEKMRRKLQTQRGGDLYKKRGCMIEPVFGQIKTIQKFKKFSMRELEACSSEWKFVCMTHNLLKLFRHGSLNLA